MAPRLGRTVLNDPSAFLQQLPHGSPVQNSRRCNGSNTLVSLLPHPRHRGMNARILSIPILILLGAASPRPDLRAQESMPSPTEQVAKLTSVQLFESLSRETKPLWRQQYRAKIERIVTNREKASLALGAVMTDLTLAMMARDGQQIRNLVQDEEALEKLLGVADKMRNFRQRYLTTADANDWLVLGRLVEKAQERQEELLIGQRDVPLASLVSIGRWLRCWQICTSIVISKKLPRHELAIGSSQLLLEISQTSNKLAEPDNDRHLRLLSRRLLALVKLWPLPEPDQPNPERLAMTQEILDELIGQLVQDEPRPPAPTGVQPR